MVDDLSSGVEHKPKRKGELKAKSKLNAKPLALPTRRRTTRWGARGILPSNE